MLSSSSSNWEEREGRASKPAGFCIAEFPSQYWLLLALPVVQVSGARRADSCPYL